MQPSPAACGAERTAAVGVVKTDIAQLAASKTYSSPTQTVGGPIQARGAAQRQQPGLQPVPVMAPEPRQMVPAAPESVSQQMERMGAPSNVAKNMHKITFSMSREATLDGLANGTMVPEGIYSVMTPGAGERAVVTGVRVTRVDSSCPQSIGVLFGDLTPKLRKQFPEGGRGVDYHAAAPRGTMPAETDAKEVFRLRQVANPDQLFNYGSIKSIEDVEKEIEPSTTGIHAVYLDNTVLGGIIRKNNPAGVTVQKSKNSRFFVQMKREKLDEYTGEVKKLLESPEFQRCLTDLSQFNMTLVPLNEGGKWDDVAEWRHISDQERVKQKNDALKAPFTVHVEGEMDIMILKKNK